MNFNRRKLAKIVFSDELLSSGTVFQHNIEDLMHELPEETRIISINIDPMKHTSYMVIQNEIFKELREMEEIPEIIPKFYKEYDEDGISAWDECEIDLSGIIKESEENTPEDRVQFYMDECGSLDGKFIGSSSIIKSATGEMIVASTPSGDSSWYDEFLDRYRSAVEHQAMFGSSYMMLPEIKTKQAAEPLTVEKLQEAKNLIDNVQDFTYTSPEGSVYEVQGKVYKVNLDELKQMYPKTNEGTSESICNHSWKPYNGLFESYHYCELCDQKKK